MAGNAIYVLEWHLMMKKYFYMKSNSLMTLPQFVPDSSGTGAKNIFRHNHVAFTGK